MANSNKVKKYHFIYKTTNLLTDKYYVGMHSTSNLKDGYLGSGKRLRYSIRKYGVENFKLEILEWFDTREELVDREAQLVNEDLLKDEMCLNLKPGGAGGFSLKATKNGRKKTDEILKQKYGENFKSIISKNYYNNLSDEERNKLNLKIITGLKRINFNHGLTFKGKSHSKETKQKIGEVNSLKQKGEGNSQFGTCWITNGIKNKKIKKTEKLPNGWGFGRATQVPVSHSRAK